MTQPQGTSELGDTPANCYPFLGSSTAEDPARSGSPRKQNCMDASGSQAQQSGPSLTESHSRQKPTVPRSRRKSTESLSRHKSTDINSSHSMGTVNHGPESGHGSWQEQATALSDEGMTCWWEEKHTLLTSMIQQTKDERSAERRNGGNSPRLKEIELCLHKLHQGLAVHRQARPSGTELCPTDNGHLRDTPNDSTPPQGSVTSNHTTQMGNGTPRARA